MSQLDPEILRVKTSDGTEWKPEAEKPGPATVARGAESEKKEDRVCWT